MMIKRRTRLIIVLISATCFGRRWTSEIEKACTGYVTTLGNVGEMDFSTVRIELRDNEKNLLAESDCSPDGFYFIPMMMNSADILYLSLNGPPGWKFYNEQYTIDHDSSSCHNGMNNFIFLGFELSGTLSDIPKDIDLQDIELTLSKTSLSLAQEVETVSPNSYQGDFKFQYIAVPGTYVVQVNSELVSFSQRIQVVVVGPETKSLDFTVIN